MRDLVRKTLVLIIVILFVGATVPSASMVTPTLTNQSSVDRVSLVYQEIESMRGSHPEIGLEGYAPHDPILIDGDSDFASQAASEGWSGDGTVGNPYIIENYDINASNANGVEIRNTTVYFVIRNCVIHDGYGHGYYDYDGIRFYNVINANIEDCIIYNNVDGIQLLYYSSNNSISTNRIHNNDESGVSIGTSSNNNHIHENLIYGNYYSIELHTSSYNNYIYENQIYNSLDGINLDTSSYNNYIYENHIYDNSYGVYLRTSSYNNIYSNDIYDNSLAGIKGYSSPNNCIYENQIYNNAHGYESYAAVYIRSSSNNNIYLNEIYNNYGWRYAAVYIRSSSNNNIYLNEIHNNLGYSICLEISSNNYIYENQIYDNDYGIEIHTSSTNNIYLNNFNNNHNVYCYDSSINIWNTPEQITYTYKGSTFTNYLGNHWNDYNGSDADGDGIGDTSYPINENNEDTYPLIEGFENYTTNETNHPPTVKITSPREGDTISGITTIQGTASDPDGDETLEKVEVKIDDGSWLIAAGTTSWSYSWDTTTVNDGEHTIYARSYDGEDYSTVDSIAVTVNNGGNQAPNPPLNLRQLTSTGVAIPLGGIIDESEVLIRGTVNDPDGDKVRLQIELRRVDEYAGSFQYKFTQQSPFWDNDTVIGIPVYGLVNGDYHWQARSIDEHGLTSEWVSFGNNDDLDTDFSVNISYPPVAIFSFSPICPETGKEVVFDATQSNDPDGGEINCTWDFGDGEVGYGKIVSHTYDTSGEHVVTLTVTDDESVERSFSLTLYVVSGELISCINNIVEKTKKQLTDVSNNALMSAAAADFFNDEVNIEQKELERKILDAIIGIFIGKAFDKFLPVKRGISSIGIWEYQQYKEIFPDLTDLIDTKGWVVKQVLREALDKSGTNAVLKAIQMDHKNKLEDTQYSYIGAFSHLLAAQNSKRRENIDELKNEALGNISSLTEGEATILADDINRRILGNQMVSTLYYTKSLLPTTLQDIREQLNQNVMMILVSDLGLPAATVILSLIFGPGAKIIEKCGEIFYLLNKISDDAKVANFGAQILFDGFTQSDYISRNTCQSLINIKEKSIPPVIKGKIVSIENFARGSLKKPTQYNKHYSFFYRDVYSVVTVENEGDVKADFELSSVYTKKYKLIYELPIVSSETKEIAPHQTEKFIIWYKKNGSGPDMRNQLVQYNLLGINNDNGFYALDMKSSIFGTTRIVTNEINVSEAELENASAYSYPIHSEINRLSNENYSFDVYIENPFEFPVISHFTQKIPDNILIISSDNGTQGEGDISWYFELEPNEKKKITIIFNVRENRSKLINISAGILKIYDRVKDYWFEFPSNNCVDIIPPLTTLNVNFPKYGVNDEWVTSSTELNFTAVDDFSGVRIIYYRIWYNGAWSEWLEYADNFTLLGEGKHYLEYYSVDNTGNVENVHNQTCYVDDTFPTVSMIKPEKALYIMGFKLRPYLLRRKPLIVGKIEVTVSATDRGSGVDYVEFYIDNVLKATDTTKPYTWVWDEKTFGRHTIKATAYDNVGNHASKQITVWKFL